MYLKKKKVNLKLFENLMKEMFSKIYFISWISSIAFYNVWFFYISNRRKKFSFFIFALKINNYFICLLGFFKIIL